MRHEELLYISIWFTHETYRSGNNYRPSSEKEFMGKEYLVFKYEEGIEKIPVLLYLTQNLCDGIYQFYHDETKTMENTSYLVNKKFTVESKYQKSEPGT
jgi:hypothetical protein